MGAARHFLRTTMADKSEEERLRVLQATLEINPKHPIITKLYQIKSNDADLARLVAEQVGRMFYISATKILISVLVSI